MGIVVDLFDGLDKDKDEAPTCINHGCNKPCTYSHTRKKDGSKRWRVHCSRCQRASWGGCAHAPGVTPYQKNQCTNIDGHLGHRCPVDPANVPEGVRWTEVDHIDGNPKNNDPTNLDELCKICHDTKGKQCNDKNGRKNGR